MLKSVKLLLFLICANFFFQIIKGCVIPVVISASALYLLVDLLLQVNRFKHITSVNMS